MKIITLSFLSISLLTASTLPLYTDGKKVMEVNPLDHSVRSVETGGSLTANQAYSDGIGMFISGGLSQIDDIDNSAMNNLVKKYGIVADAAGSNLAIYVKNNPDSTIDEKSQADKLLNVLKDLYPDDTPCDDGNPQTSNDVYLEGVCIGSATLDYHDYIDYTLPQLSAVNSTTGAATLWIEPNKNTIIGYSDNQPSSNKIIVLEVGQDYIVFAGISDSPYTSNASVVRSINDVYVNGVNQTSNSNLTNKLIELFNPTISYEASWLKAMVINATAVHYIYNTEGSIDYTKLRNK